MVDNDPGSRSAIAGAAGGQETPHLALPPAIEEFLGSETAEIIGHQIDRLEQIEGLARTRNPFITGISSDKPDLSSMDPDMAYLVDEHVAGRWPGDNYGLPPDEPLTTQGKVKIAGIMMKLSKAGIDLQGKLTDDSKSAESALVRLDRQLYGIVQDDSEYAPELDLSVAESAFETLSEAAELVPSETKLKGLKAIYAAAIAPNETSQRALRVRLMNPLSFIARTRKSVMTTNTETASTIFALVKGGTGELEASVSNAHDHGMHSHRTLVNRMRTEQVNEAVRLLRSIDEAKQRLPIVDRLEAGQLDSALEAERFFADQAEKAQRTIRSLDSSRLGRDVDLWKMAKRGRTLTLAAALATRRAMEARQQEESRKVKHIPEAHDVLLGGQRLKPGGSLKTAGQVRHVAEALADLTVIDTGEKALDHKEAGLVVAIVTDHFDTFSQVFRQVREESAVISKEQAHAAEDLQRFDLEAALVNIRNLISAPERPKLKSILATDSITGTKAVDMVGRTVRKALEQQRSTADAA